MVVGACVAVWASVFWKGTTDEPPPTPPLVVIIVVPD